MKKVVLIVLIALMAVSVVLADETKPDASTPTSAVDNHHNFSVGLRAGYGSVFYSYKNKDTKAGQHSGFSGFPIDLEFCYRIKDSKFGAMGVLGLSIGRNYYDNIDANKEVTKIMGGFGKVMFDSFFSVYGKFKLNPTFDLRLAIGPTIKVYEAKQKSTASFTAFILGLKLEGALQYDVTSILAVNAGIGFEYGLINTAKSKSEEDVKKNAHTFGWNLFLGAGFGF